MRSPPGSLRLIESRPASCRLTVLPSLAGVGKLRQSLHIGGARCSWLGVFGASLTVVRRAVARYSPNLASNRTRRRAARVLRASVAARRLT